LDLNKNINASPFSQKEISAIGAYGVPWQCTEETSVTQTNMKPLKQNPESIGAVLQHSQSRMDFFNYRIEGGTLRRLLKVLEAAVRMRVSEKTVRKMVYGRKVDVVRIGRSVRIPEDSIDKLIDGGTTPAKDDDDG
jgi:excisionase family DNA binding protein